MPLIDKTKGAPVDRTAALVTSRSKIAFDPTAHLPARYRHSDKPFPMRRVSGDLKRDPNNITGLRSGRLVVLGLLDQRSENRRKRKGKKGRRKMSQWVVRCDCGRYEVRSARAMRSTENKEDRCQACWKLADIQRRRVHRGGLAVRERWEY